MAIISEINPETAPASIQKIIAAHLAEGHALTAEKRTLRPHPWQEPEREATPWRPVPMRWMMSCSG